MKTKRWETLYVAPAISAALDALAECMLARRAAGGRHLDHAVGHSGINRLKPATLR